MRVTCPDCRTKWNLPRPLVGATLIDCVACGWQFTARPPGPKTVHPEQPLQEKQPNSIRIIPGPVKPVVLAPWYSHIRNDAPHVTPLNSLPLARPVRAPDQDAPPVAAGSIPVAQLLSSGDDGEVSVAQPIGKVDDTDSSTAQPRPKKRKRFRKKQVRNTGEDSSSWGVKIAAGVMMLLIMAVIGAVFGVGKLGFLKSNKIVEFNDKVVDLVNRVGTDIERSIVFDINQSKVKEVHRKLSAALQELNGLSVPAEGREFHQATARFMERLDRFFSSDLTELSRQASSGRELLGGRSIEQMLREIEALEDGVIRAQQEMARKNNFELTNSPYATFRRRSW